LTNIFIARLAETRLFGDTAGRFDVTRIQAGIGGPLLGRYVGWQYRPTGLFCGCLNTDGFLFKLVWLTLKLEGDSNTLWQFFASISGDKGMIKSLNWNF
jgi:hypothetical protein